VPACKVARFGNPLFTEVKLKRILLPQLNAIIKGSGW